MSSILTLGRGFEEDGAALYTNWKAILKQTLILPGLEPGTLRVWSARDNLYTTESKEGLVCCEKLRDSSTLTLDHKITPFRQAVARKQWF